MAVLNQNKKLIFILTLSSMITGIQCWSWWKPWEAPWIKPWVDPLVPWLDPLVPWLEPVMPWVDPLLPWLNPWNYSWSTDPFRDYNRVVKYYSLLEPWQMPKNKKVTDLRNITSCNCPRVFMPVCAMNNVTYVNSCIMNCWKLELRRDGPCVIYRRIGGHIIDVVLPEDWKNKTYIDNEIDSTEQKGKLGGSLNNLIPHTSIYTAILGRE